MNNQSIRIPVIKLKWSGWFPWNDLKADARRVGGVKVPNKAPGVYEVRKNEGARRLTIGRTANLRQRVKEGLVKGKTAHSAGVQIRKNENVSKLWVRWAETNRPAAVEEALHYQYRKRFGKLPKYTDHT